MIRIIVFGSRTWTNADHLTARLARLPRELGVEPGEILLVHGDCKNGADFFADEAARELLFRVERHPAIWRPRGAVGPVDYGAGPRRNRHMASLGARLAIGFRMPGKSSGTDNMRDECELREVPVERHGWDWRDTAWHGVRP
jgi:hypothetical protein